MFAHIFCFCQLFKTPTAVHRRPQKNLHVLDGKAFFQTAPRPLPQNVVVARVFVRPFLELPKMWNFTTAFLVFLGRAAFFHAAPKPLQKNVLVALVGSFFRCILSVLCVFLYFFCVFCGFCDFWSLGGQKGRQNSAKGQKNSLPVGLIFGTLGTLFADRFLHVFSGGHCSTLFVILASSGSPK